MNAQPIVLSCTCVSNIHASKAEANGVTSGLTGKKTDLDDLWGSFSDSERERGGFQEARGVPLLGVSEGVCLLTADEGRLLVKAKGVAGAEPAPLGSALLHAGRVSPAAHHNEPHFVNFVDGMKLSPTFDLQHCSVIRNELLLGLAHR